MLETGAVRSKNSINILYKNILDASVAALGFWFIGYMFAYGTTAGGFIGIDGKLIFCQSIMNNAGEGGSDGFEGWFFQWAFAGAAATIVSGAVAERTKFEAYLVFSFVITVFIYPVVVHWGWGSGFLSAWGAMPDADGNARPLLSGKDTSRGMIDFAGSGIVHMVGGVAGLMGAIIVGPRTGRFVDGKPVPMPPSSPTMMALGTLILWFGWYGFNCGSTLMLSANAANVAAKVAMTTTLAASSGCVTMTIIARLIGMFCTVIHVSSKHARSGALIAPQAWCLHLVYCAHANLSACNKQRRTSTSGLLSTASSEGSSPSPPTAPSSTTGLLCSSA